MNDAIKSWANPRPVKGVPREHEPPREARTVELTLFVETNEDDHELLRKIEWWMLGHPEPDKLGRTHSRMPWWLRRVDVETILVGDDE